MTNHEIDHFRKMLETREQELMTQLRRRDGIAIEKSPDALDEVHIAAERELATRNLERESKLLREVRAAMARIEEGAYGECARCEEEISMKRLKAVPWAPRCIECQEEDDQDRRGSEAPTWSLMRAA
jgi:DnaK suppressor protein